MESDSALCARVRSIAMALPGAKEKTSHGSPVFYTTKAFVWCGAHVGKTDPHVGVPPDALRDAISFLPDTEERQALLEDGRFYIPGYIGPRGWLAYDLSGRWSGVVDWGEVAELIEMSYRNTAGVRLIKQLDAQSHLADNPAADLE